MTDVATPSADPVKSGLFARDLSVQFSGKSGGIQAVESVSLHLAPGKTLGLVGESGSGKSMTALALMGLLPAAGRQTTGEVRLNDEPINTHDSTAMDAFRGKKMAMVFQEPMTALNPTMTLGDLISEPLIHHLGLTVAAARDRVADLLSRVGIQDAKARLNAYPHQLSGGMRQRAMIALAISCDPTILIADEPTTALDVTVQAQVLDLLGDLSANRGLGVLLISHDLAVVSEVCDDILVMYAGTIVERGPTAAVINAPHHPYTLGLIRTLPAAHLNDPGHKRLPAIPGQVPELDNLPPGCRFSDRCPLADDHCRATEPELAATSLGRAAACFKSNEVGT